MSSPGLDQCYILCPDVPGSTMTDNTLMFVKSRYSNRRLVLGGEPTTSQGLSALFDAARRRLDFSFKLAVVRVVTASKFPHTGMIREYNLGFFTWITK